MDVLEKAKVRNILIILSICTLLAISSSAAEIPSKKFALEMEYGSAAFTPPPLNDIGSTIYGNNIVGTPFGGNIIYVLAPRIIVGANYNSFSYGFEKAKAEWPLNITNDKVEITQIVAFIDLSPYALGSKSKNSIASGIFIEVGPSLTQLKEEYILNGVPYSFTSSGYGINVRLGYRTLTKDPLSFFTRAKINIPVSSDNKKSDSGLQLSGAITISVNIGICLSF